ncbi:MAG TPA: hypothetical protein VEA15_11665 [Caulobacteraceae bacterium]|nr:hypothetical protein [Caulobacteraceae bacterium]
MTVRMSWPAVPAAETYRVTVREDTGSVVIWTGRETHLDVEPGEYRVQALVGGRFETIRPYQQVDADMEMQEPAGPMFKALLQGLLTGKVKTPLDGLTTVAGERALREADWAASHILGAQAERKPLHWDVLRRLEPGDGLFRDVYALLSFFMEGDAVFRALAREQKAGVEARAADLTAVLDRVEVALPSGAHAMNRGRVASLFSRAEAAPLFAEASFKTYFDNGAHTYFAEVAPARVPALDVDIPAPGEDGVTLVLSVDPRFLRFYAPYWFNLAPFLARDGYRFLFLVIGEGAEQAISESRDLLNHMIRYRGLTPVEPVTFVPVSIPEGIGEIKTFYACARFLHASEIVDQTGRPILIIDADMVMKEPLGPMLSALAEHDFGRPCSAGSSVLSPWRREVANTVFVNATDGARRVLDRATSYALAGLPATKSWMLDQNALSYATEDVDARCFDISGISRPLFQERHRSMFERIF